LIPPPKQFKIRSRPPIGSRISQRKHQRDPQGCVAKMLAVTSPLRRKTAVEAGKGKKRYEAMVGWNVPEASCVLKLDISKPLLAGSAREGGRSKQ